MAKNPFQSFVVSFPAHEEIFSEGQTGATMYIVQSGKVRLYRMVDGRKQTLAEMEKGDFFSEMSILEGLPRQCSAEAIEDVELIEISSMTFDKMIKGNIEIAVRMLRKLSIRLREAERKVEALQATGAKATFKGATTKAPAKRSRAEPGGVRLEAVDDGTSFPLQDGETLVGRYDPVTELRPDIDLTEVDLKRSVSRRHARISSRGKNGIVIIEEVGALNGTFVNGVKLVTGQPHPLTDGDQVGLGMVKMVFRTGA